ncbi:MULTISPECIES: hypothetical protein [Nitrospirillum]|uniref:Uncharacterized protein n=1 Tax=Nitrospirillum amazonense TaxID=28077 RepID=A0A560FTN9_9PROT|nr:hypothetical protein [Nitrospirillum amazonense]MEC4590144.1 hypothetical protein [Nitrospirillum amazonense]TWB24977.1 hypothetical protein FBZ88_11154 [Nitrospirillum amazonense]
MRLGRLKPRWSIALLVAGGVGIFALANAHLIHVARSSWPGCVPHQKPGTAPGASSLSAAQSSC